MAYFFVVIFVVLSCTAGSPVYRAKKSNFSPKKVADFAVHISEAGEEYNEKKEVDPNKGTDQVPAHPGVDRSGAVHDFKQMDWLADSYASYASLGGLVSEYLNMCPCKDSGCTGSCYCCYAR